MHPDPLFLVVGFHLFPPQLGLFAGDQTSREPRDPGPSARSCCEKGGGGGGWGGPGGGGPGGRKTRFA